MTARERAEGQQGQLEGLKAQSEGRRQAAASLGKRGKATLASCKAARELMVRQATHLAAAVQKLEVNSAGPEQRTLGRHYGPANLRQHPGSASPAMSCRASLSYNLSLVFVVAEICMGCLCPPFLE